MATRAKRAFQTYIKKGNGAVPEVFSVIAEVKDLSGPSRRRLSEEVTNMDSPEAWAEFIATTLEAGDVTFQLNLLQDDVTQVGLTTDFESGVTRNWQILIPPQPATKRIEFAAFIQEVGFEAPVKGALMSPLSLKVTGPVHIVANT